jgi:glycosyltransferase involved in cell wall biosynthesis
MGNSRAVVRQLSKETEDSSKIGLIYNGIDLAPYEQTLPKLKAREELNIAPDATVFVIVANLISYKGHEDLLAALADVKDKLPQPWVLLCLGRDDGIGPRLERLTASLSLVENIRWLGELPDVPKYLAAADIGLLCSHEEGFSNSILEGMASGLPMIVTDVGGNAEAVVDGETGIVVPARDPRMMGKALSVLAADKELCMKMGEAARVRAKDAFSIEKCVASYAQLYSALLENDNQSVSEMLKHAPIAQLCSERE